MTKHSAIDVGGGAACACRYQVMCRSLSSRADVIQVSWFSSERERSIHWWVPEPSPQMNIGGCIAQLLSHGRTGTQQTHSRHMQAHSTHTHHEVDKKNVLLEQLYIKRIVLPRQARDKHRKNSKKQFFLERNITCKCVHL